MAKSADKGTAPSGPLGVLEAAREFDAFLESEEDTLEGIEDEAGEDTRDEAALEGDELEEEDLELEEYDDEEGEEDEGGSDVTLTVRDPETGEELEITAEEAAEGWMRRSDYTRKTMALAEERKSFTSEIQAVQQERAQYAEHLGALEQLIQNNGQPQITPEQWDQLARENPQEFNLRWARHQQQQQQLADLRAERERVQKEQAETAQAQFQSYLAEEAQKLHAAVPEWGEEAVAKEEQEMMMEYALSKGFSPEEAGAIYDHRLMLVLRDAARYQKARQGVRKVTRKKNATPTASPGNRTAKGGSRKGRLRAKKSMDRLRQTGNVRDAASVFETYLEE